MNRDLDGKIEREFRVIDEDRNIVVLENLL